MKITDYSPRAAPFDSFITGENLIGVEIGVDVGAHAHAMLAHCDIRKLYLVDPWPREFHRGYCEGRLRSHGYGHRIELIQKPSLVAAEMIEHRLGFVYIDQEHDGPTVAADLAAWWPKVIGGGILGYRNYNGGGTPLEIAIDDFIKTNGIKTHVESGEIILFK